MTNTQPSKLTLPQTPVVERPLICSGTSVKAILRAENPKTKTRRVIKEQFTKIWGSGVPHGYNRFGIHVDIPHQTPHPSFGTWKYIFCPYGKVGDRLWVREKLLRTQDCEACYPLALYDCDRKQVMNGNELARWQWKHSALSPLYMPRWASRILLEIVSIKVERLCDISQEDAIAEGLTIPAQEQGTVRLHGGAGAPVLRTSYVTKFITHWNYLNEKRGFGWTDNPWVWVIEFRRV